MHRHFAYVDYFHTAILWIEIYIVYCSMKNTGCATKNSPAETCCCNQGWEVFDT